MAGYPNAARARKRRYTGPFSRAGVSSSAGFPTSQAFEPYQAPPIPTGSYDPAIDAQVDATNRGYGDTRDDAATGRTRLTTDYGLGRDAILRAQTRGTEDLATATSREDQNYNRTLELLQRSYGRLAGRQTETINAAGVLKGGAMLQAAAKRAANQAQDRQGIDTTHTRAVEDAARAGTRLGEDTNLQLGALALQGAPPDANNPLGGRAFQDLNTSTTRAGREAGIFRLDAQNVKAFQAAQAGYVPPGRGERGGIPKNEFVDASGKHYRVIVRGNQRIYVDEHGRPIKTVGR